MKHYKFSNPSMPSDEIKVDPKTGVAKVVKYKEINVIAEDVSSARLKAKVFNDYQLVGMYTLNKDWNVNS